MGKQSESSISLDSKQFVHELISALQHEIRNDITNIQSNSYFLFRKIHKPTTEAEEYMQRITTKSDKILRQVYEMSDLFQIHNKTFKLDVESFNIIPFLEDTVEIMKKLYPKRPITLTTPGEHSIMIEGDKKRIEMLLKRLISHTNEYGHIWKIRKNITKNRHRNQKPKRSLIFSISSWLYTKK
jgi:signal transduction histidine kinase